MGFQQWSKTIGENVVTL